MYLLPHLLRPLAATPRTLDLVASAPETPSLGAPQAGDGARTRDIKLGRLALYQLSYSRERLSPSNGGGRIRTFEGLRRQIYSLIPLATWVPHRSQATA